MGLNNSFHVTASLFTSKIGSLNYVLAHEHIHTWLGHKITNYTNFNKDEDPIFWFMEGFTDYYADYLNNQGKIISSEEYIKNYNHILKKYFTSPEYFLNPRDLWLQDTGLIIYYRGRIFAHELNRLLVITTMI